MLTTLIKHARVVNEGQIKDFYVRIIGDRMSRRHRGRDYQLHGNALLNPLPQSLECSNNNTPLHITTGKEFDHEG